MAKKTAKKRAGRVPTGMRLLANGDMRISVKGLHAAIDRLEPLFAEAQQRKPRVSVIGEILTHLRDLRSKTDCQRTMTFPI